MTVVIIVGLDEAVVFIRENVVFNKSATLEVA